MFTETAESILNPSGKKVNPRLNTTLKIGEQRLFKFSSSSPIYSRDFDRSDRKKTSNKKFDKKSFESFKKSKSYEKIKNIVTGKKEVVVKVTGYSKGSQSVHNNLLYVSRNHEVEVINENGEVINDKEIMKGYLKDFTNNSQLGKPDRKNVRDTAHFALSYPEADKDTLINAVQGFAEKNFNGHEYLLAYHHDEDGVPHVHLIVQTRNKDLTKTLRINRKELAEFRDSFAENLRELGEEPNATRRISRGEFQRPKKQIEYHSKSKEIEAMQLKSIKENLKDPRVNNELETARDEYKKVINSWSILAEESKKFDPEFSKEIENFIKDKNLDSRQESTLKIIEKEYNKNNDFTVNNDLQNHEKSIENIDEKSNQFHDKDIDMDI